MEFADVRSATIDSDLEKTCWVLEGAGFEGPEPMSLKVMEKGTQYAKDGAEVHESSSRCKEGS